MPPPRDVGAAEGSERRRIEIATLRQEVATLLRMNSSLHARLNQANTREPVSAAGSFANLDMSASAEARPPLAWFEERKSLEQRAQQLTEECRALEAEKSSHEANGAAAASAEPAALAGLLRDRDDMRLRLHATESARTAAERRVVAAEAALLRSREELERRKRQSGVSEESRFGPWLAEEVKSLRRELAQEQAKLDDVGLALARKNEQVTRGEREQAEARVEYDALVAANEALRKDIATMKEKVESDRQAARGAEAELGEAQAQFRLQELNLNSEVSEAKARASAADDSLKARRAELEASESVAAASKAEGLELQGQIEVLRAAHEELLTQERREAAEHEGEATELRARAEVVAAERAELERHLEEVESATRDLQASDLQCQKQLEHASREVQNLRTRGNEAARRSQDAMAQAEQRIQALLQQINDERQQNQELEREVSIAKEVASELESPSWEIIVKKRIADEKKAGKTQGWASTAFQMHRELELMQRWKNEALDAFRRMQGDMESAQQQYQQQLQHNQGLQERLEQMGHQAKATVIGFSSAVPSASIAAEQPSVPFQPPSSTSPAPWSFNAVQPSDAAFPPPPPVPPAWPLGNLPASDGSPPLLPPPPPMRSLSTSNEFLSSLHLPTSAPGTSAWPAPPGAGVGVWPGRPEVSVYDNGMFASGPDVPERSDVRAPTRANDLRPSAPGMYPFGATAPSGFATSGPTSAPAAPNGVASAGPVAGPFYDAFRARPSWQSASRVAARADPPGSRRRRSSSIGRSSNAPVVAPLLASGASRPLSAGAAGRRK